VIITSEEIAAAQLAPHFDATRDVFASFQPAPDDLPGMCLEELQRTRMVVDSAVHDSERHYGRCRDDGLLIEIAPEATQLPFEQLIAMLAHEMGHAADFLYPGCWVNTGEAEGESVWIGHLKTKPARVWRNTLWHERSDDHIEWDADAIAYTVTGLRMGYCGHCMVQCFSGGKARPEGLR
jgi:hypothetical protein